MALGVRWLPSLALIACFASTEVLHLVSAAGRAYPIDSENYITYEFQRINRRLDWDVTNFLVDLSGRYSLCSQLFSRGSFTVDRRTPEGETIAGYIDYTDGSGTDVNSVKEYLKTIIDRWINNRVLYRYIHGARRFGCSVRPGCSGHVVTTCLFSLGGGFSLSSHSTNPTTSAIIPSSTTRQTAERTTPKKTSTKTIERNPIALAFTREQYHLAESTVGTTWDRSHFLENLSGLETNCTMIDRCHHWKFTKAVDYAARYNMNITGRCGFHPNNRGTPEALEKILGAVKLFRNASHIGCSLIPDCHFPPPQGQMYVVVSCLYQN